MRVHIQLAMEFAAHAEDELEEKNSVERLAKERASEENASNARIARTVLLSRCLFGLLFGYGVYLFILDLGLLPTESPLFTDEDFK